MYLLTYMRERLLNETVRRCDVICAALSVVQEVVEYIKLYLIHTNWHQCISSIMSVKSRQKKDEADADRRVRVKGKVAVHQQGFTTCVFLGSRQSHDWLSARPRGRGEDTILRVEHLSSYNMIKHNAISNNIKKFKLTSTLILMVLINNNNNNNNNKNMLVINASNN